MPTRMSPVSVYDRRLLLDFAPPRTHAFPGSEAGRGSTVERSNARKIGAAWQSAQRHKGGVVRPCSEVRVKVFMRLYVDKCASGRVTQIGFAAHYAELGNATSWIS